DRENGSRNSVLTVEGGYRLLVDHHQRNELGKIKGTATAIAHDDVWREATSRSNGFCDDLNRKLSTHLRDYRGFHPESMHYCECLLEGRRLLKSWIYANQGAASKLGEPL